MDLSRLIMNRYELGFYPGVRGVVYIALGDEP
jgi:hypothetical protein